MKKTLLFLFAVLLTFGSCSNDDEQENVTHRTIWTQEIGDKSLWLFFDEYKNSRKGSVSYTETELNDDSFYIVGHSYMSMSIGQYEIDKNNIVKIYEVEAEIDSNTGYPKINVLFTGYLRENKIYLEGNGINGEEQTLELTQYIPRK